MKKLLMAVGLAAVSLHSFAGTNVGVSVSVNQPGVYGRIDIGNAPQPPVVVYQQPMIVQQPAVVVDRRPIYLHVPPGHSKNWRRYCGQYNACGQPVYFVREDWYQNHYRHPRRVDRRDDRHDRRDDRRDDRHDRHDDRRDHRHDHRDDHRDDRGHQGGGR